MGGGVYCVVSGCPNNSNNSKHLSFFTFPTNEQRFKKWVESIGRGNPATDGNLYHKSKRICSMHFEPSMMVNKRLTSVAYPTLNLSAGSSTDIVRDNSNYEDKYSRPESSTQTGVQITPEEELTLATASISMAHSSQADDPLSLRDIIIKEEYEEEEETINPIPVVKVSAKPDGIKVPAPDFQNTFLNWQKDLQENAESENFSKKEKHFALNLHLACPSVYRLLLKEANLPPVKTLENMKIIIDPGANESIIKVLERKIGMLPKKFKYCVLCLNKMKIRKHLFYDINHDEVIGFSDINGSRRNEIADTAVIMTVKGCIENWRQPIGYGFLGTEINLRDLGRWICEAIKKLFDSGFQICAIVTDQNPLFTEVAQYIGVSVEKPFFTVDGIKIFYIYNVPDLIKDIRDCLLNCDLVYDDDKCVKWSHIQAFYDFDKAKNFRLAPKLTDNHLNPKEIHRKKIPYAAQVFSYKVAAGLSFLTSHGTFPEEAHGSVDFVLLINNTFDVLNSVRVKTDYKYKAPYKADDYQLEVLKSAYATFSNVRAAPSATAQQPTTDRVKSTFANFQITIKSISKLFDYLRSQGVHQLYTRRFSRDSIPTIFSASQQKNLEELSAIQLRREFSKLILSNLIKNSTLGNSEQDISIFMATGHKTLYEFEKKDKPSPVPVDSPDYRFKLPVANSLLNVSTYLYTKCRERHDCSDHTDNKLKHCSPDDVPDGFIKMVQTLEGLFLAHFENAFLDNKVGAANAMLNIINEQRVSYRLPCGFPPMAALTKLFIRTRIYYALKFIDKHLKKSNGSSRLKLEK